MQVQAVNVTEITGVETTEDGLHALVRFKSSENEAIFAFPFELLMPLMQTVSTGFSKCEQAQSLDPKTKHILPCENFAVSPAPDFSKMVFSFHLPGGMEMSYEIPREHAAKLREFMTIMMQDPGKIPAGKPQLKH
jgi:hypothetical protein